MVQEWYLKYSLKVNPISSTYYENWRRYNNLAQNVSQNIIPLLKLTV